MWGLTMSERTSAKSNPARSLARDYLIFIWLVRTALMVSAFLLFGLGGLWFAIFVSICERIMAPTDSIATQACREGAHDE
jgi:hypothetical protein